MVLKGLYFSTGEFLEAKKGSTLSWLWGSKIEEKEILKKELLWQVGNGGVTFECGRYLDTQYKRISTQT